MQGNPARLLRRLEVALRRKRLPGLQQKRMRLSAEVNVLITGHVIQLELTTQLLAPVARRRRPANGRTAAGWTDENRSSGIDTYTPLVKSLPRIRPARRW